MSKHHGVRVQISFIFVLFAFSVQNRWGYRPLRISFFFPSADPRLRYSIGGKIVDSSKHQLWNKTEKQSATHTLVASLSPLYRTNENIFVFLLLHKNWNRKLNNAFPPPPFFFYF